MSVPHPFYPALVLQRIAAEDRAHRLAYALALAARGRITHPAPLAAHLRAAT